MVRIAGRLDLNWRRNPSVLDMVSFRVGSRQEALTATRKLQAINGGLDNMGKEVGAVKNPA